MANSDSISSEADRIADEILQQNTESADSDKYSGLAKDLYMLVKRHQPYSEELEGLTPEKIAGMLYEAEATPEKLREVAEHITDASIWSMSTGSEALYSYIYNKYYLFGKILKKVKPKDRK